MFSKEYLRCFATRNSVSIDWLAVIGFTLLLASMVLPVIPHARCEVMLIACQ
jgi:hypothetical protein